MARIARVTLPRIPHHITQRGNRRMQTFFGNGDYLAYINHLPVGPDRREIDNSLRRYSAISIQKFHDELEVDNRLCFMIVPNSTSQYVFAVRDL